MGQKPTTYILYNFYGYTLSFEAKLVMNYTVLTNH